jgi:hypothetical protein
MAVPVDCAAGCAARDRPRRGLWSRGSRARACGWLRASWQVTFEEMLTVMFQYAKPEEIQLMLSWVAPEPEPEPEPKAELSAAAKSQINGIFKLFDKDKSGTLTFQELKKALEKTGIDPDEIKQYFTEYDFDGNGTIDKDEFFKLMESTGAFDND